MVENIHTGRNSEGILPGFVPPQSGGKEAKWINPY
jgi:hypothetical protein